MKKIIKTGLRILSLGFIFSITIGTVVSCSNNKSNIKTNDISSISRNSTKMTNNSENSQYEQNARIVASLLPALFPKNINISAYNETVISMLSTPSLKEQLSQYIKSQLIYSMNTYVCGGSTNYEYGTNPIVLTVSGTNYTASEIAVNLTINFPSILSLNNNYKYNEKTLNVTFSFDNYPINFSCTLSGFVSS